MLTLPLIGAGLATPHPAPEKTRDANVASRAGFDTAYAAQDRSDTPRPRPAPDEVAAPPEILHERDDGRAGDEDLDGAGADADSIEAETPPNPATVDGLSNPDADLTFRAEGARTENDDPAAVTLPETSSDEPAVTSPPGNTRRETQSDADDAQTVADLTPSVDDADEKGRSGSPREAFAGASPSLLVAEESAKLAGQTIPLAAVTGRFNDGTPAVQDRVSKSQNSMVATTSEPVTQAGRPHADPNALLARDTGSRQTAPDSLGTALSSQMAAAGAPPRPGTGPRSLDAQAEVLLDKTAAPPIVNAARGQRESFSEAHRSKASLSAAAASATPSAGMTRLTHAPMSAAAKTVTQSLILFADRSLPDQVPASLTAAGPMHGWDQQVSQTAQLQTLLNRPELPAHISRQMAEAMQRMPDRPVELTLSPEELGRVRMSIATHESGITVNVIAERPETLDLMRRHIEQLGREFMSLGYGTVAFSFGDGQAQPDRDGHADGSPRDPALRQTGANDSMDASIPLTLGPATGLDLRL